MNGTALRTYLRQVHRFPAMMANQFILVAVVRIGQITPRAAQHKAAAAAVYKCRIPFAVQKEDGLLSLLQPLPDRLRQFAAKQTHVALRRLLPHIRNPHLRQRGAGSPPGQGQQGVFALLRPVIRLYGWRGRAEHQRNLLPAAQLLRHLAGVISRHFLRLVRGFMLLVDQHQS